MSHDIAHSTDRLAASAFLAIAVHALLIFGISFALPDFDANNRRQRTLDIVLAHSISDNKPEETDFLGQANQEGGGSLDDAHMPSVTEDAPILSDTPAEVADEQLSQIEQNQSGNQYIISGGSKRLFLTELTDEPDTADDPLVQEEILAQNANLSNIAAPLEMREQLNAKKSNMRRVSARVHQSRDAAYLDAWRRKIEYVGNLNYDDLGAGKSLYGSVLLAVGVKSNGNIAHVRVEKSSNIKVLDDFALRIIYLAAPFDPFPEAIKKDTDVLEIVRYFKFEPAGTVDARKGR